MLSVHVCFPYKASFLIFPVCMSLQRHPGGRFACKNMKSFSSRDSPPLQAMNFLVFSTMWVVYWSDKEEEEAEFSAAKTTETSAMKWSCFPCPRKNRSMANCLRVNVSRNV